MHARSPSRVFVFILLAASLAASPAARGETDAPRAAGGPPAAGTTALVVDVRNDAVEAVSVPLGSDNGVTGESDFSVMVSDDVSVPIYPAEIFNDRFWSQPLPTGIYGRIRSGMAVRPAHLSKVAHAMLRAEGEERLAELRARKEEARRQAATRKAEELKEKRVTLLERRDALDNRIAAAEKDLVDEEGRLEWVMSSADDDIDRASQRIADLADRREELQSQRGAVSQQRSAARGAEASRLTSEIGVINGQINTEREKLRFARDRKRSARSSYLSQKQDWQRLAADRKTLSNEIKALDLQIRELSAR